MKQNQKLEAICKQYEIGLVYLFGSQCEESYRFFQGEQVRIEDPMADIDIGVVFLQPLPPARERYSLYAAICNDFGSLFSPLPVDLSFLEENHSVFQLEALKGRCIYFTSVHIKDRYEDMILRRAADFRPVLELFHKEALEEVLTDG